MRYVFEHQSEAKMTGKKAAQHVWNYFHRKQQRPHCFLNYSASGLAQRLERYELLKFTLRFLEVLKTHAHPKLYGAASWVLLSVFLPFAQNVL